MSHATVCICLWLLAISRVWYVGGSLEHSACRSKFCVHVEADESGQAGKEFSLLQTKSTASKSTPARMRPAHNNIAGGDHVQEELSEDEKRRYQHGLKQNGSTCAFPSKASTTYDVWNYFKRIGFNETGFRMNRSGIDGKALWNFSLQDLNEYGMNDKYAQTFLDRLETKKAQKSIRQAMMDTRRVGRQHKHANWTLHNIVGPDGALMITLDREIGRFNHSATMLKQIGVNVTKVNAVDSANASEEDLERGCWKFEKHAAKRMGEVCKYQGSSGTGCFFFI